MFALVWSERKVLSVEMKGKMQPYGILNEVRGKSVFKLFVHSAKSRKFSFLNEHYISMKRPVRSKHAIVHRFTVIVVVVVVGLLVRSFALFFSYAIFPFDPNVCMPVLCFG